MKQMTLENLRKVALAATQGPWRLSDCKRIISESQPQERNKKTSDPTVYYQVILHEWSYKTKEYDLNYVSTFNPTTVLALLDALQEAREGLEKYADATGYYNWPEDAQEALTRIDSKLEDLK
jgi:ABC-type Fe3+-hydroxamate transport system substrate-binding protein